MDFRTIKENEQVLIFNRAGSARQVAGPRRIWLKWKDRMEYLPRYVASQDQYMVIQHRDGHKEHIRGPVELFLNRLEIDTAYVKDAIKVDANHMLVVYKQLEGLIERRLVQGPTLFVPEAYEWLHEFIWHGSDRNDPGRFIPGKKKFFQLRHVPSHLYCSVRDVRTNDISVLTVKLMIFFQLADTERMLTYTHDPIADFINAVSADVIAFASLRSYEEFIRQTEDLNSMDCYKQLTFRAKHIGYHITKMVYRGYEASRALQNTHAAAVRTRMKLKLDAESEEQEQTIMEFKLKREKERTKLKHEMEIKEQDHKQELQRMAKSLELEVEKLSVDADLEKKKKEVLLEAEMDKLENNQKASYLKELCGLNVDNTRYLVAKRPILQAEKEVVVSPAPNINVSAPPPPGSSSI